MKLYLTILLTQSKMNTSIFIIIIIIFYFITLTLFIPEERLATIVKHYLDSKLLAICIAFILIFTVVLSIYTPNAEGAPSMPGGCQSDNNVVNCQVSRIECYGFERGHRSDVRYINNDWNFKLYDHSDELCGECHESSEYSI